MSESRYIEVDSTYRNRNQYSSPSSFVMEISQSGQSGNPQAAKDPISNASPILFWNNSFQESTGANSIGNITVCPTLTPTMINNYVFKISSTGANLRQIDNFYVGASLIATGPTGFIGKISEYQPLDWTDAIIGLDTPVSAGDINFNSAVIINPTPLSTNSPTGTYITFFIPGAFSIDNYYTNYYIENINTGEAKKIVSYDGTTHLATLDSPTITDWLSNSSGPTGCNFCIRKELPINVGTTTAITGSNVIQLGSNASMIPGAYNGAFMRMIQPFPFAASGLSYLPPAYSQESRITNYVTGNGTISAISGTTYSLSTTAQNITGYFNGCFFSDTTAGNTVPIISSNAANQVVLSSAVPGAALGDTWRINTAFVTPGFTGAFQTGTTGIAYEIEQFSRDNWFPFFYSGSQSSVNEEVCYEVELLNLVLPNTTLLSGRGGRAIFHPYLYVELQQVSGASAKNRSILYSNNPHSNRMLFRALVNDTSVPSISPFIRIDGDGMTQTIKFKPNDSFKFAVYHPNGDLFQTVLQDNYSPTEPNPLVQISACFGFKRVAHPEK